MVLLSSESFVGDLESWAEILWDGNFFLKDSLLASESLFLFLFLRLALRALKDSTSLSLLLITASLKAISGAWDFRFNGSISGIVVAGVDAVVIVFSKEGSLSGVGVDGVVAVVMVCIIDGGRCGIWSGLHEFSPFCMS